VPVSIRDLRERGVEHENVVGRGVAARVRAPQRRGEELTGVVAKRQHRVIAERLLERRRRLLLLAVADHDGRIQVNHEPGQLATSSPCWRERLAGELGALRPQDLPRCGPRPRDLTDTGRVELVEQPPARRVRRHRPEQLGLIAQHRDIRKSWWHHQRPRPPCRPAPDQDRGAPATCAGPPAPRRARCSAWSGPRRRRAAETRHATPRPRRRWLP
jgi:hypothetical protein